MVTYKNIYDYIVGQEAQFTQPIDINGWSWNFKEHVKMSFYYKHGRLLGGNDDNTPVKNITRPLLNLQYRTEDVDVKDIVLYVDDADSYFMSFLVKKYHDDVFVVENDLDSFFNEINESKVDYGGGLAKKMKGARPERIDMQSIAFCDQTNMLSAPLGIKHFFNPAELKDKEKDGWGNPENGATISIDDLIELSRDTKINDKQDGIENKTTGNYVEIYEVIGGALPQSYLDDSNRDNEYVQQYHIAAFYRNSQGGKTGVSLFRKKDTEERLKLLMRDEVFSRALGFGGAEEVAEDQVWTNSDIIRMQDMLDAASLTILKSIGTDLKNRYPNGLKDMNNLAILELNEGEDIGQIDTSPRNMALFQDSVAQWEQHAQTTASAQDPLLGKQSPSGTPFRAQERQVIEGKGLHEYRIEKFAKFIEAIYIDWIIPHIQAKITKGAKFLSSLSTEEMKYVADAIVKSKANEFIKEEILSGRVVTQEMVATFEQQVREDFLKGGNKKFVEILQGEFKKQPIRVKVNVSGKQKNLELMTDKVVNIFRQIIANPEGFRQTMQIDGMAENFNKILEFSGLSPAMYAGLTAPQEPQQLPQQGGQAPPQQAAAPDLQALQSNQAQV